MYGLGFHHRRHKSPPEAPIIRHLSLNTSYHRKGLTMSTATLKWTPPSTRLDGTALAPADIAQTEIFDAPASGPAVSIGKVPGPANVFTTDLLTVGLHQFTAVVTDTGGHVSAASNIATATIVPTVANPSPITDLSATINPDAPAAAKSA